MNGKYPQIGRITSVPLPDKWPGIQDQAIDAMIRLEKAFRPHLKKITA
jgi:hypothetical protein